MRERTRWYINHGISEARYQELKWFSRQYDDYKRTAAKYAFGEIDHEPGIGAYSPNDPTARDAINAAYGCAAWKKALAIEKAAILADAGICKWIIRNVTEGITYEALAVPCGRRQFFQARRRYFIELDQLV